MAGGMEDGLYDRPPHNPPQPRGPPRARRPPGVDKKSEQPLGQFRQRHTRCRPVASNNQSEKARNRSNGLPRPIVSPGFAESGRCWRPCPSTGRTLQPLHCRKIDQSIAEYLVGGMGAVHHVPGGVVTHDRRASESLEDPHLDFVRDEGDQPVEALAKAGHILSRQADDQVRVQMNAGLAAEPCQVLFHRHEVLTARDEPPGLRIPRLNADLELQGAGGNRRTRSRSGSGKRSGTISKWANRPRSARARQNSRIARLTRGLRLNVRSDDFELSTPAIKQAFEFGQQAFERELPNGNIERRQAEFTFVRTPARGLHIHHRSRRSRSA